MTATVTEEQAGKKAYVSLWHCSPFPVLGEAVSGDGDLRRSLLYAGPRQGRHCLPRLGNIKPCLLTSCCPQRLPLTLSCGAASHSLPSGVLKGKEGQMVL